MLRCLYASDYGPPDPGFDPLLASRSSFGAEFAQAHRTELATAHNADALQAVRRKIDRGESFVWCDQGYGWTHDPPVEAFFVIVTAVVLPYALIRLMRRLGISMRAPRHRPPAQPAA